MASGNLQFRNGSSNNNVYLSVDWWTSYKGEGQFSIHVEVWINANMAGYARDGSNITVDGTRYNFNGKYYNSTGSSNATWVKLVEYDKLIWHSNWYQTQAVPISVSFVWTGYMWNGSTVNIGTLSGYGHAYVPWEGPAYVQPPVIPDPQAKVQCRVWNGAQWCDGIVQVWNGAQWLPGKIKVWNGAQWIDGS